ncbi:hypothetical protein K488DRAFT_8095, partial [Vararia minispora EC-137]
RGPDHLPRAPNAFLLYRSFFCTVEQHAESKHNLLSKRAAERWNELKEHERAPFKTLADLVRDRHAAMYPNYKYVP